MDENEFYKYNCWYVVKKEGCPNYIDGWCEELQKDCIWDKDKSVKSY